MRLSSWKLAVAATLSVALPFANPVPAVAGANTDAAVITGWNAIAVRTIFTENATPVPSSGLYFGFVSLAVYDAVVAINGGYRPYLRQPRVDRRASTEAAAATAAHDVLVHYFPTSATALDADLAASLAAVPDGRRKTAGRQAGATAAASLIRVRATDGRNAPITFDRTPGPGVWRPDPAPMLVPWLGFVQPLTLRTPTQPWLRGPDPLDSRAYRRDLAEVRRYGSATGSLRTAEQTETALFWSANAALQYQNALRDQVTRRGWDAVRAARAFAMASTAEADAMIRCWRAKYDEGYWRPIAAIREDAVDPDPSWTPLQPTPPYPDYASGHACFTGSSAGIFTALFGPRRWNLEVSSSVTGTTRHYDNAAALVAETRNARIWLGFHFRRAMEDGSHIGFHTAQWVQAGWFQPARTR